MKRKNLRSGLVTPSSGSWSPIVLVEASHLNSENPKCLHSWTNGFDHFDKVLAEFSDGKIVFNFGFGSHEVFNEYLTVWLDGTRHTNKGIPPSFPISICDIEKITFHLIMAKY